MIAIADSRFQAQIAAEAKRAGKLDRNWRLPRAHRRNTPARVAEWLAPWRQGILPDFPLGTEFTEVERRLMPALDRLRTAAMGKGAMARLLLASVFSRPHPQEAEAMTRMGFAPRPHLLERPDARALRGALRRTSADRA